MTLKGRPEDGYDEMDMIVAETSWDAVQKFCLRDTHDARAK